MGKTEKRKTEIGKVGNKMRMRTKITDSNINLDELMKRRAGAKAGGGRQNTVI